MPTQRPFLSNFLAAFRAHQTQIPKAAPSISTTGAVAAGAQTIWTTTTTQSGAKQQSSTTADATVASPKPINSKQNPYNPSSATSTSVSDRQFAASLSTLQHNVSPQTHLPRSPPSPGVGVPVYGPQNKPQPSYPTVQESRRARRGSDSSSSDSGGFREVRSGAGGTGEKWFIGGRSANGEEKYYKLSMVRRDMSADRLSADRLSL